MSDNLKDFIYRSDLKQFLKDEFKKFSIDDFKSFLRFIGNNPDLQSANQAMLIFKQDPLANNVETQLNISFIYNREVTDINNTISVFDPKEQKIIPAYSLSNTHAIDSNQNEYEKTTVNITSRAEFNQLVNSFYPDKALTVTEFFKNYVDDFVNPTAKGSEFNIAVSQALLSNFIPSVSNNEMLNLIKADYKLSKIKFNDIKNLQYTIKMAINNIRDSISKIREDLKNEHHGNNINEGNGRTSTFNQGEVSENNQREGSSVTRGRSRGDEIYSSNSTERTVEQGGISQRTESSTVHLSSNADSRDELSSVHSISESSNTDELVHEGRSTRVQSNVENASRSDVSLQTNDNNRDDSERKASELHQDKREENSESSQQDSIRSQREEQLLRTERSATETVRDSESVHRNSEGISATYGSESARSSDSGYRRENDSESDDVLSDSQQTNRDASESNRLYSGTTNSESEKSNGNSKTTADVGQKDESKSGGLSYPTNDSTSISSNGRDNKQSISNSGAQNISEYSDVNSESTAIKSGTNNSEVDYSNVDSNTQTTDNSKSEFESTDNASTVTSHQSIFAKIATNSPILSSNTNGSNAYIENSDFTIDYQNESERFEKNISALKLLKTLEKENRVEITEEEKQVLLGYTGFGGFDYNSFDDSCRFNDKFYSTRRDALFDIGITDKEYTELLKSTSTAYYTHTDIIDCIYEKLADFGFKGGKVLEPSCGVGKFIGRMPKELSANSQITGVEIDPLTAKIASLLYPKSVIKNTGFEKTFAENYYDVAIGNVPFGSFSVFDNKNPELNNLSIHNYFFEKALKEVKPGGVVAFITSSMTMDSKSSYHREELAKKAHFLGAVRLPNNTFESSDTDVMTDIIFLKKRDIPLQMIDNTDPQFDWVNSEGSDQAYVRKDESESDYKTIYLNNYFNKHPEQIAGKLEVASGAYGPRYVVRSEKKEFSQDNIDQIRAALKNVSNTNLQEVSKLNFDQSVSDTNEVFLDTNFKNAAEFSFYIDEKDDVRFKTTNFEKPLTYKEIYDKELSDKSFRIFKDLLKIKDLYKTLRKLEIDDAPDSELSDLRNQLSDAYDNFRAKNIKQVMRAKRYYPKATDKPVLEYFIKSLKLEEDNSFNCLTFLEQTGKKGQYLGKSKIFTERVLFNHKEITSANTHQDALTLSINNKGKVDIPYMAKLLNRDPNELAESMLNKKILYIDPDQILFDENNKIVEFSGYVTEDEYLSGNIYKKIDSVNNFQSKYDVDFLSSQIEDLKKVIPQPLTPNEISSKIGARWIDADYYTEFLNFFCSNGGINGKFVFNSNLDQFIYDGPKYDWGIDNKFTYAVTPSSGRGSLTAKDIFLKLLNGESLIVSKSIKVTEIDETGKSKETTKRVDDEEATAQVLSIAEKMQQHFDQWIFSDLNRRTKLVDKYNRLFNSIRPREYNGDLFTFDNINPDIKLRPHQKNAIARSILGGNSLFAHEVGAGKTFEMCVSAMEKIRLGKANRCVFVMPKPILAQFANDFYRLYPNCNILMPDNKDFSAENRRHFINRLTFGDHKIILLSKEQFAKIPMSLDYQDNYIKSKIDQEMELLRDPYLTDDVKKKVRKNIDKLNSKLEKLYQKVKDKSDTKSGVTFEEIGCDALYVDEAHNYKNAYLECHTDGIPSGSKAGIALDMQMKCQYLNDKYDNNAIVFATGTPISNSVVDLYTMQTYLNQPALHDAGIYSLDAFIAQFGSISSELELDATAQNFEFKSRLRSFRNVPDALKIFGECADIKTSEDLKDILTLPTPHFHIVTSPASKTQEEMIDDISARAIKVKNGAVDSHIDNMLKISSDGRKIGLDPRLNDPLCPDNPNSKINKCAENIKKICDEDPMATQLVFCDLGTPPTDKKDDGKFNVYDDLKNKLVDMGLKPSEVRFIHEFNTDEEREKCFEDINAGEIKVLMGSTAKLGTGVNVQECLKAVHHLDINWKPSDLEQRNGRIIRQGNTYKDVDIYTYVSVGTFDSFMFQTVKRKADFIKNIMNNSTTKLARNVEIDKDEVKFSLEDCLAVSIKDPRIRDQLTLQREIGQLESEKKYFINNVSNVSIQVNNILPENIKNCNNQIHKLDRAISILNNNENAQKIILSEQKSKDSSKTDNKTAENEEKKFFVINVSLGINKGYQNFTDMQSAGKQILSIAAVTPPQRKVSLGSYCGLLLFVKKVQGLDKNNNVCFTNNVYFADPNDRDNILNESSPIELGDSPSGNITRITNAIKNFYVQSDKVKEELQKLENELTEKTAYLEKNKNWDKEDILEAKKKEYEDLSKQIAQGCNSSQKSEDIFLDEIKSESQDVVIEDAEIVQDNQESLQENNQDNVLKDNHIEIVNVTPELIVDEYQQQLDAAPEINSNNSVQYKSEESSNDEVESDSLFISGNANDELLIKSGGVYLPEYKVYKISKSSLVDYRFINYVAYNSLEDVDSNSRLPNQDVAKIILENHITDNSTTVSNESTVSTKKISI